MRLQALLRSSRRCSFNEKAGERFFGFVTENIRNPNTRWAYYKAAVISGSEELGDEDRVAELR